MMLLLLEVIFLLHKLIQMMLIAQAGKERRKGKKFPAQIDQIDSN